MSDDLPVREPELPTTEEVVDKVESILDQTASPKDMAVASLVTGVAGMVLTVGCSFLGSLISPLLGAAAVVTGWHAQKGLRDNSEREKMAFLGLGLGVFTLAIWLLRTFER